MHPSCFDFVRKVLKEEEVRGRRILDVGSRNINGTVRPIFEGLGCVEYIGIDKEAGDGVDCIMDASDIVSNFGKESFDVIVSTEMMEHAKDWRKAIYNIKEACKNGGVIILTCRSSGFPYHGYPEDYWRFEGDDFKKIFADCIITNTERDTMAPGIFLKAYKPLTDYKPLDLSVINVKEVVKV
jgi:SAM-dependent methyltransferase